MRTARIPALILGLAVAGVSAQDKQPTPEEEFKALRKEAERVSGAGAVMTDTERLAFVGRVYKQRAAYAVKFLALAEKYPSDPIALEALMQAVWQVNTTPWPVEMIGDDPARPKAFEIIHRDHIKSDKLVPLCQRVSYGFAKEYETFLRAVLEKNPHVTVRGAANLSLGHFLNNRLQRIELCREEPKQAKEFAALYGREYLAELIRQDGEQALKEVEVVFEDAAKLYGEVKLPGGDTVAERVTGELFEIRKLRVGNVAPDIEGEDQDGKRFKLSDYRGKVVLLDFWSFV